MAARAAWSLVSRPQQGCCERCKRCRRRCNCLLLALPVDWLHLGWLHADSKRRATSRSTPRHAAQRSARMPRTHTPACVHACACRMRRGIMLAGSHPNAGEGLWGSSEEVPSFLYAMPLGGNRCARKAAAACARSEAPLPCTAAAARLPLHARRQLFCRNTQLHPLCIKRPQQNIKCRHAAVLHRTGSFLRRRASWPSRRCRSSCCSAAWSAASLPWASK